MNRQQKKDTNLGTPNSLGGSGRRHTRPSTCWAGRLVLLGSLVGIPLASVPNVTVAAALTQHETSEAPAQLALPATHSARSLDSSAEHRRVEASALRVASDFNGDGFADLAIGVPDEDVGTVVDAGGINVIYGTPGGPSAPGAQFWTQEAPGVRGRAERRDRFGSALAQGDFNGDGFADLAIGVPNEDVGVVLNAGAVNVLYGSAAGLASTGNQLWAQSSPGIKDAAQRGDRFGFALAAGDLDRDGYADLAVGVPYEDLPGGTASGAVNVLYGSALGLRSHRNQFWNQNTPGIKGAINNECSIFGFNGSELCERFGWALAAANFGNGRAVDLAIGVPGELSNVPGYPFGAGAVNVIYGKTGVGLTALGNQLWSQATPGVKGDPGFCDPGSSCVVELFGAALAAGNFGKGFQADLAVGVPGDYFSDKGQAGGVNVLYGSSQGLSVTGNQLWNQDSPGVLDEAEGCYFEEDCIADRFGAALAAANFGNGSFADLAVGVPQESLGPIAAAGAVNVLYGSTTGLTATGNQFWTQDSPDVADVAEESDGFGSSLFAADFGQTTERDLAIGVPGQDVQTATDAGAVNLLFGSPAGLSSSANQFWHQDGIQVLDPPEPGDRFGKWLG